MNIKTAIRFLLLGFVLVAIGVMVRRELVSVRHHDAVASQSSERSVVDDHMFVYYFHGNFRCPTCQKIESYATDAVRTNFPQELSSGRVTLQTLNYESPENAELTKQFDIAAPTVVLLRRRPGAADEWKNLDRVWTLVGEKDAFMKYVSEECSLLLASK